MMDLAYCGLNCNECLIYLAFVSKNTAEQIRLANKYSTDTGRFSKEDMDCLGCHSDTVSQKMYDDCKIRLCGAKKSYGSCAECDEFPCSTLEENLGNNSDNLNNLKQLAINHKKAER